MCDGYIGLTTRNLLLVQVGIDEPKKTSFVYLREFIGALKHKEEAERAQTALMLVASHVRRSTQSETGRGELTEVGVPLARTLLHLDDRFTTPGFDALRRDGLVALVVCKPELVLPFLTRQVRALWVSTGCCSIRSVNHPSSVCGAGVCYGPEFRAPARCP